LITVVGHSGANSATIPEQTLPLLGFQTVSETKNFMKKKHIFLSGLSFCNDELS